MSYLEYFPVDRPSPSWIRSQGDDGLTPVYVRGPVIYVRVGDWVSECHVTSVAVTTDEVTLLLSANGGYAPAILRLSKFAIIGWETVLPTTLATTYLELFS